MDGVKEAINYYNNRRQKLLSEVNSSQDLSADMVIEYGKKLSILEYKLTALEIAIKTM